MKSIRNLLAVSALAGSMLTLTGMSMAAAADDAATAAAAAAGAAPGTGPGWQHRGPGHMLEKLGLDDAQKASVKSIMRSAGPQLKSIHEQMRANMLKLRTTQPNDPNYANVVAEVSQSNGTLHAQMTTQMADVRAQVFKVLTPAQQQQLATLEAQMPQGGPHHRGGPGGRGE